MKGNIKSRKVCLGRKKGDSIIGTNDLEKQIYTYM